MPTLEITEAQASFLDALRDAIEDELVGPYGTVRRQDAMQYLIDNYGEPDELLADASETDVVPDEDGDGAEGSDGEGQSATEDDATEDDGESDGSGGSASGGDAMLDEMMSLLEDNDDVWEEADTEETRYEVELPDGDRETVQTKDDVRALLFKHYR